jgi:hypothetical protein
VVKRILRYLRGTVDYGLRRSTHDLLVYTDVDCVECPDTRQTTSVYAVFLVANMISWSSKLQYVVSRSGAEAEYRVVANGVAKAS